LVFDWIESKSENDERSGVPREARESHQTSDHRACCGRARRQTELFLARRLLLNRKDFFALVMPAMWANVMRLTHLVTVWTRGQIGTRQRQMTASAIAASFR
jgi:hypothetical protein